MSAQASEPIAAEPGFLARYWHRIKSDPMGALGLFLVLLVVFCGILGPWITPFDPYKINVPDKFQAPSLYHLLGTDNLGRDVFSRIIAGSRIALSVGVSTIAIALALGLVLGLAAGYGPRWLDNLLVLIFDSFYSFPTVILALLVAVLVGANLAGVLGALIAIPTAASLGVILDELVLTSPDEEIAGKRRAKPRAKPKRRSGAAKAPKPKPAE